MELDLIKLQTTWNDAASSLNTNFSKIKMALASRQGGGESPVIGGIMVNGMPYTDDDGDGFITLPDYPKKLSALENDLNLGSFAYKNALAVSDIPDLSGKYLPLTGGTMGANAGIGFRAYNAIDGGGGWAIDALTLYNRNQDKKMGTVSFHGGGNELYYIYIGVNAYNGNNLRIYPGSVRFGDNHILHSGNYSDLIGNTYLNTAGGTISGTSVAPLVINTSASDSSVVFRINSVSKTQIGYNPSNGSFIYNYSSSKVIGIKDDGTPHYNGNTLLHSGNVGDYAALAKPFGIDVTTTNLNQIGYGYIANGWQTAGPAIAIGSSDGYTMLLQQRANGYGLYVSYKAAGGQVQPWKTIAFTDSTVDKAKSVVDANGNALTLIHSGNANKADVPWTASNILFPTGTSATWNTYTIGAYKGITVLNAIQAKPEGAPDPYAVGLSVSGYYGFVLASLGGGDVLLYRRKENTDWKTIAFTDSNVASAQALAHSNGTVGAEVDSNGNIIAKKSILRNSDWYIGTIADALGTGDGMMLYSYQKPLYFGNGGKVRMLINSSGNVTIGGGDLASTTTKLYVDGGIRFAPRTIWGQSFDGTGDVDGNILNVTLIRFKDSGIYGIYRGVNYSDNLTANDLAYVSIKHAFYTSGYQRLFINEYGNVTIGGGDLASASYKFYVDGNSYTNGNARSYTARSNQFNTGDSVGLYAGSSYSSALTAADIALVGTKAYFNGNVLIGTTTDNGSGAKLQVNGNARISGAITIGGAATLKGGVEVHGSTPYIDFHYNNSTSDYTSRIIEDTSGRLYLNRVLYLVNGERAGVGGINSSYKFNVEGTTCLNGATTINGKVSASGGIDIPNGQQLAFLDASGNRHTIAWDSASNGILIDGNLIVLGELATGLPMQEIPSIPEIGV